MAVKVRSVYTLEFDNEQLELIIRGLSGQLQMPEKPGPRDDHSLYNRAHKARQLAVMITDRIGEELKGKVSSFEGWTGAVKALYRREGGAHDLTTEPGDLQ